MAYDIDRYTAGYEFEIHLCVCVNAAVPFGISVVVQEAEFEPFRIRKGGLIIRLW